VESDEGGGHAFFKKPMSKITVTLLYGKDP
jgi:hypothetical protein